MPIEASSNLVLQESCVDHTFSGLATRYLNWPTQVQPYGPVWCSLGSIVAFEMALQIAYKGETIVSLSLLDPILVIERIFADIDIGFVVGWDMVAPNFTYSWYNRRKGIQPGGARGGIINCSEPYAG
ncbi:hypothetical protein BX600DRAFT_511214 [Xylariales sp. PMI_506]|nr:hypothetical protein BX600DRAFT_511214 [Xylariales sp. PMI_506]